MNYSQSVRLIVAAALLWQPPAPALAAELADPAFDRYVDTSRIGKAADEVDAQALVDAALQLAEGERILFREHRSGLSASGLLKRALAWSATVGDKATIERIAVAAKRLGDEDLQTQAAAALKVAGAARDDDGSRSLQVDVEATDPETLADINRWQSAIRRAAALGDSSELDLVRDAVDEIEGRVPPKLRDDVIARLDEASKAAARQGAKDDVLIRLAGASRGYETNKFDLKSQVEKGGWVVAWADDVSETDVAKGVVAVGVSVYTGNPAAFYAWIDDLIARTVRSLGKSAGKQFPAAIARQAQGLAAEVIRAALRGQSSKEVLRNFDTVDFKAGAIRYSGRNTQKIWNPLKWRHEEVTLSTTWGMKPYVAFRLRGSTKPDSSTPPGNPPSSKISYSITNSTRGTVMLKYWPSGNTQRLAAGQTVQANSPIRNGEYPKVVATTASGDYWERTIRISGGRYRIVDKLPKGIQITP
jgi:hypothetical protein